MCALRRHPSALDNPKISVVIPVYNEKNTIEEILRRVAETRMRKEIVIVDDCSTDGTRQYLESM
ncbi:MAG: glycosyltransferase, partial [Candidatus Acidiferrum sp.]